MISDQDDSLAGEERGDGGSGEVEVDAAGEGDIAEVESDGVRDVEELDELGIGVPGGVVVDLGDDEVLL